MKNSHKTGLMIVLLLFVASITGCASKAGTETKPPEKANTAQSVQTASPAVPQVDPAKAAESENLYKQGIVFYEQYNYQDAVAQFDRAIAANPNNYKVYTAKGIALCFEEDYKGGMELIQKTLDINPEYVPAFYDMAMAYKLQNQYDESLFWFEKTIQGDPENTWSYYGIATIYADMGKNQQSLQYLQKAIELDQSVKAVAQQQAHFDRMRNLPEFQALVK